MITLQKDSSNQCDDARLPVSVIIVNYNAGSFLTACVSAIAGEVEEIVIVDNASTDASITTLASRFPAQSRIKLIQNTANLGFAAACNIGFRASTAPYILFLNPDCEPQKQSLQRMLSVLESDSGFGMVGGQLINPDGTEQGGARRDIPTPWRAFVRASGLYRLEKFWPKLFPDFHLHKKPLPDKLVEVEATSGAVMLVRREALEAVDGWDEGYFLHCEDLDLCMRFRQKGWKILFVPDVQVLHYKGVCSQPRPIFVAWHKHRGIMLFYRKFFQDQYPRVLMWLIFGGVWMRFAAVVTFHSISYLGSLARLRRG